MYYKSSIEARSHNHFCCGTEINITYSEYASVALFIQHAKRMRPVILSSLASLAVPYFSISQKRQDFRGGLLNVKFVFGFL